MTLLKEQILLMDAGGTFIKTAIATKKKINDEKTFKTSQFHIENISNFINIGTQKIDAIVIACAGPVKDGKCQLANANLLFDENAISAMTKTKAYLINDLEAAAYFLSKKNKGALVIGIGTGLGVSVIDSRGRIKATEDGHSLIDRELFFSIPELRNTLIPQYEHILGAKKNILAKILNMDASRVTLKEVDKYTQIYMRVLDSFIKKMLEKHKSEGIKKIIFIGGVAGANKKYIAEHSAELHLRHEKNIEIIDDKFIGLKGALQFYIEKTEKLMN